MSEESVYTAQDRANEGCCWTYYRDHCPGGGCLCDCHATNEEILLSDRASLRREVDRERQAFAELTTASVSRIEQLTARAEAAEQQAARLREALAWYADEANYDQDEYDHENVPGEMVDSDKVCSRCHLRGCREFFEPDRGGRARAAIAASQPAPAVETERRQQGEQEADR